jgi:hypothetical protein
VAAFLVRRPDRDRGRRRLFLRHRGQRLDESSDGLHAGGRPRDRRAPVAGAVRQPDVLERVHAHVLRGLHRLRVPAGRGVRVGDAARAARTVRADRLRHHDDHRRRRGAAAGDRGRLGRPRRRRLPAGQAGGDGRPGDDHPGRGRAPARLVQRARGGLGHRNTSALVVAGLSQPECGRQGAEHRPAVRPAAGERGAVLVPDHGRDRHPAGADRPGVLVPAVPAAGISAAAPASLCGGGRAAVGGRADRGLDHDRGRPPAVDRLRRDAGRRRGDRGERHPDRVRDAVGGLRDSRGDRLRHLAAAGAGAAATRCGLWWSWSF